MTHFEIEILYDTTYKTACGVVPTVKNSTRDERQVSCPKCLIAMGLEKVNG